jgi:SAM-dependent methyltransferase
MPDRTTTPESEAGAASGPVERFEEELLRGELVEAEHVVRYLWAAGAVEGKDVLDVGCGTGYGCALLAAAGGAARCRGIDLAEEAVAKATERYGGDERLEFVRGDAAALPVEDESIDAITCFETIEHVADPVSVVSEAARVLRKGGLFFVSSPNRAQYPPGNPYHVKEFLPDELRSLLSQSFPEVRLYRQHNWLASAILDDGAFGAADAAAELDVRSSKLQGREPGDELYTLAVCSAAPLPDIPLRALVTHGLEVRRWLGEISDLLRLGDELAQTRETLAARERELLLLRDRRSTTMGQLERQAYWLQRADIDPDVWARRRPVRAGFRLFRLARKAWRKLRGRAY